MVDEAQTSAWRPKWNCNDLRVPKEHYTSDDFARLEFEKVWLKSWQMVCREEQIATSGEYFVYSVGGCEFLIVRQEDGSVKAYHNVCPHRGAALASGIGRFGGGLIQCPYHAWRWRISGENIRILDQQEFQCGALTNDDVALRECGVAQWSGWIFINPDPAAVAFDEHVAPLEHIAGPLEIERQKLRWWRSVRVPVNWKAAMQAFQESYHTEASHPQLWQAWVKATGSTDTTRNRDYQAYANGHGSFGLAVMHNAPADSTTAYGGKSILEGAEAVEAFIAELRVYAGDIDALLLDDELFVAECLRGKDFPDGMSASNIGSEYRRSLYETYRNKGRFIPSPEALGTTISVTVFPNLIFMPSFGNMLVYRARPDTDRADSCIFDLFSMRTFAEGEKRAPVTCQEIEVEELPLVFKQDFRNILRVKRGLQSPGIDTVRLSQRQEAIIWNVHQRLEQLMTA